MTSEEIIRLLDLKPHPEGGFYKETYRSSTAIPGIPSRAHSTAIYYLLVPGAFSRMHRLKSDEIFHYYMGGSMTWVLLGPGDNLQKIVLGGALGEGQVVQMAVPAGTWFGGFLNEGSAFVLMGTTVAPGFEFADFEIGSREELLSFFPKFRDEILKLT